MYTCNFTSILDFFQLNITCTYVVNTAYEQYKAKICMTVYFEKKIKN